MPDARTYLYVDGENFTIRARKLQEELDADEGAAQKILESLGLSRAQLPGSLDLHEFTHMPWSPQPTTAISADRSRTPKGIAYHPDDLYWDGSGLAAAIRANLGEDRIVQFRGGPFVHLTRSFYFTTSTGTDGIDHTKRFLHDLGFIPCVLQRMTKPDAFARECLAHGVTVVTRPKTMDISLATQVLEDAMLDNFDRCIFVGGDEDYLPLFDAVRRRGKLVWLVAFSRWIKPSSRLRFACDRFISYDPILISRRLPKAVGAESGVA